MDAFASTHVERALAELARRQWGVVSRAQLATLGLGRGAIDGRLRAGRLRRVHRGVYAIGGAALPREGRHLAAVLAYGPGAVLSHTSAAVHWGLLAYDAPRPEVTAPASRTGVPGIRLHRTHSLDARDATDHRGVPVTTVAKTLLDVAAQAPRSHLEHALGQALRNQLSTTARSSTCSNATAGAAESCRYARPRPMTRPSRAASWSAASAPGAAVPVCRSRSATRTSPMQTTRSTRSTSSSRPTASSLRPTAGADHWTRVAFERDRAKDAALVAAGYAVLRFTKRQIADDPGTVAERVRAGCSRAFAWAPGRAW